MFAIVYCELIDNNGKNKFIPITENVFIGWDAMKKTSYIAALILLILAGCKENQSVAPHVSSNYSGKYANVLYNDNSIEPTVTLNLTQNDENLSGVGCFNGIEFNFSGTLVERHAVLSFDLLDTNVGDLRGCTIDGYFGDQNILAGGYTLTSQFGTEKIRFKQLEKAQ